ncbi:MAG TPA: CopG family transcriptional regulator, partial [Novosphingobium sp.]|nr:CopG family transcriptional regulator [Novosphingobium sp.]
MKSKHTFRLPPDLADRLADYARRKRGTQAQVVETALNSFLSPDGSERMEAAFSRRIDKVMRQLDKLDYQSELNAEALALFVRFWLTAN